jgi:hypothetical protein
MRMAALLGEPVGRTSDFARASRPASAARRASRWSPRAFSPACCKRTPRSGIGCVIFDEFHERSLNADLGLALCIESQQACAKICAVVMSATLDSQALARLLRMHHRRRAAAAFEVATHYVPRRPSCTSNCRRHRWSRSAARSCGRHSVLSTRRGGNPPRAAHPGEADLDRSVACCRCMANLTRQRRMRRSRPLLRRAQNRARDQHCRNQPHHRGHSRRGRFRAAPLFGIRSRHRHEPPGHRQGVAGRCRSAPRARRTLERGRLLSALVGRVRRPP